jgi:hypothetical protein
VKTRKRPFANPATLQEMLELRGRGWSLPALARKYHVRDHAAIQYHCKRNGMYFGHENKKNLTVFYHSPQASIRAILSIVLVWWKPDAERINPGKTYKEYVAEHNKRHPESKISIPKASDFVELPTIYLHENDIRSDSTTSF